VALSFFYEFFIVRKFNCLCRHNIAHLQRINSRGWGILILACPSNLFNYLVS